MLTRNLVFVVFLSASMGYASDTAAPFTVEEAVSRALNAHPAVQGAFLAVEEEQGAALQAGLPPNPEVDIGVESWSVSRGADTDMEVLVGVSQRLPLSGARRAARKAGMTGAAAAGLEAETVKREIAARVARLFYEILAAQERTVLAEENCNREAHLAELTRKRFELGDLPEVDWIRADAEHERYRGTLNEALRERDALRARLAHICGMTPDTLPDCSGEIMPQPEDIPQINSLEEWLASASRHRAHLLRETQAVEETEALRRMAMPEPSLRVGWVQDTVADAAGMDVGLSIGLPLFDRNQGSITASKAREQRIRAEREASLQEEIREAGALLDEVYRKREHAIHLRDKVLAGQEQSREILSRSLELGGASLFEVLAGHRAVSETRLAILENEMRARFALLALEALL